MIKIKLVSRIIRAGLIISLTINVLMFTYVAFNYASPVKSNFNESSISVTNQVEVAWEHYAQILEDRGVSSFWLLTPLSQLPEIILLIILWKLFGLYQQGVIFTKQNINYFRQIGKLFLIWEVIVVLYPVSLSLILNFFDATLKLPIFLSFGQNEFSRLIIGISVYVIAWVMNEAINLKQEQDLVI